MREGRTMLYLSLTLVAVLGICILPMAGGSEAAAQDQPTVVLDTSMGPVTIELDRANAPITVDNFLKYVDSGHFDGTIFHRVIPGFMVQGGGFGPEMREKSANAPIKNESANGLRNQRGTLAMARTSDPNSASAQFFINLKDNGFLDRDQSRDGFGYAVFGRVIDGMEVVDKMAGVATATRGGHENVPTQPITITSAKRKAS